MRHVGSVDGLFFPPPKTSQQRILSTRYVKLKVVHEEFRYSPPPPLRLCLLPPPLKNTRIN